MIDGQQALRTLAGFGVIGTAVLASACGHVGREEFQSEVDLLRQEMTEGDRVVQERVSAVDTRVDDVEARLDAVESELRNLEQEFDMTIERLEGSLRVHLPVHFAFDDDRIETSQQGVLDRVGSVLTDYYPGALLTVEGMTDPSGSAEYNMRLGQRRADAVRTYFVDMVGWQGERIRAVSYGESRQRLVEPGAQGPGATGRANRRAVVVIEDGEPSAPPTANDAT
jgi:peptidoglycan-associated lipoprotein